MTSSEVAAAITRAEQALIKKLSVWDGQEPEKLASEFVTAMMRHDGWRPTEARPLPAWQRPAGTGKPPTDRYLQARAQLEEHLAERDREAS